VSTIKAFERGRYAMNHDKHSITRSDEGFVDEEMGEGGYRDPSDYFNALSRNN